MKVLQQLIQHFWRRSALTPDRCIIWWNMASSTPGTSRPTSPRKPEPRADRGDADDERPEIAVLLPDELDHKEEELSASAGPRHRAGNPPRGRLT